ncbi:hypothetical protein CR513_38149, partial [Mucuna pruriens]
TLVDESKFELQPGKANIVADALSRKSLHVPALMVRELDIIEQFRDLSLVCEVTLKSVWLGMLKITSSFLDEIKVGQQIDPFLDGAVRLQDRVRVPSVPSLRKLILEEGHRNSLSGLAKIEHHKPSGLTKSTHFIPVNVRYSLEKLTSLYISEIIDYMVIVSDRDLSLSIDFGIVCTKPYEPSLMSSWDNLLLLVEFTYNNSYDSGIGMTPYEALYDRRCRTPLCWLKLGESLICKDLEFKEGDHVFLKTGVGKALKSRKLSPCFIGPYQIIKRVEKVTYQVALPPILANLHNVFHVSHIYKYLDDVQVWDNLSNEVLPVRIEDHRIKLCGNMGARESDESFVS